jgi:hypothetical protein
MCGYLRGDRVFYKRGSFLIYTGVGLNDAALLFLDFYALSGFFSSENFVGFFPRFRRPLSG